jgi:hypothetical protein
MATLPINEINQPLKTPPLCDSATLRLCAKQNQDIEIEKTLISKSDHYNILI